MLCSWGEEASMRVRLTAQKKYLVQDCLYNNDKSTVNNLSGGEVLRG